LNLTTGGATGGLGVFTPIFENMGLVIRPKLHGNRVGWCGGRIENVIEYRLRRDWSKPAKTAGNCISANPKFISSWGREGPRFSPKLARTALVETWKAFGKIGFSCTPTFKH